MQRSGGAEVATGNIYWSPPRVHEHAADGVEGVAVGMVEEKAHRLVHARRRHEVPHLRPRRTYVTLMSPAPGAGLHKCHARRGG
eukprot:6533402-Pyramimonas_sp.AAC.1